MSKTVYQTNHAGLYTGTTVADPSPLEPGVFLMPAGTVETPPPESWPEDKWPRWNGAAWQLIPRPQMQAEPTPAEKLAVFLAANPDVQALIQEQTQ